MASQLDYEDGNALGGALTEVFAVDITAARATCRSCGRTGRVAELRVYRRAPGLVARCPGCGEPILRFVHSPTSAYLDLTGTVALVVPLPE